MEWARMLAYITGTVDQGLLLRNEYLATENRILRAQVKGRLILSDAEEMTLADIGYRLGRKALEDVANAAKPDTILGWYRKLIARKFDGSKARCYPGRPARGDRAIGDLVGRMAKENVTCSYDRIVGALSNLGHILSHETVGNIQGNALLFPLNRPSATRSDRPVRCRERLAGLLKYYHREVARSARRVRSS